MLAIADKCPVVAVEYDATSEWIQTHLVPDRPFTEWFEPNAVQQACRRAAKQLFENWNNPQHSIDTTRGLMMDVLDVLPCPIPVWLETEEEQVFEDLYGFLSFARGRLLVSALEKDGLAEDRVGQLRKTLLEEDQEEEEEEEVMKEQDEETPFFPGTTPEETKRRFTEFIKNALQENARAIGRANKEAAAKKLFTFLVQHQVLLHPEFAGTNFCNVVRDKLIELDGEFHLEWIPSTFEQLFSKPLPRLM